MYVKHVTGIDVTRVGRAFILSLQNLIHIANIHRCKVFYVNVEHRTTIPEQEITIKYSISLYLRPH